MDKPVRMSRPHVHTSVHACACMYGHKHPRVRARVCARTSILPSTWTRIHTYCSLHTYMKTLFTHKHMPIHSSSRTLSCLTKHTLDTCTSHLNVCSSSSFLFCTHSLRSSTSTLNPSATTCKPNMAPSPSARPPSTTMDKSARSNLSLR
jgi:hypothetical protein